MLRGLVHTCTCMYVFLILNRLCTLLYIPVPSLNKDFVIIIMIILFLRGLHNR